MKKAGVRGVIAAAIVCIAASVLPKAAGAATNAKCSSNQIDIFGGRTRAKIGHFQGVIHARAEHTSDEFPVTTASRAPWTALE